jgi:8-oxo-dGTP pyrophosphatase MutT (NUDIX family)
MQRSVMVYLYRSGASGREYLLLRRTEERGGYWQPVTGHVEAGEELADAAIREVQEETGCRLEGVCPTPLLYFFVHNGTTYEHRVFYSVWPGGVVKMSKEHTEYRWVLFAEALQLLRWEDNKDALARVDAMLS